MNTMCVILRLRKVWQKRKCSVRNGFLTICHGTVRRHILLLVLLHAMLRPAACMSISQLKNNLLLGFFKRILVFYLVSYYFFLPSFFYFDQFLHEESNGQSGQSKQQRKRNRRRRRRRSIRRRITERRVGTGRGVVNDYN